MRTFETGATRDSDDGKYDWEGFLSPLALARYGQYMHKHRIQADGKSRASDNWQQGILQSAYMKSLWRHLFDVWAYHRWVGRLATESMEDALCGVIFNAMGMLHEWMKDNEGRAGRVAAGAGAPVDPLDDLSLEKDPPDGRPPNVAWDTRPFAQTAKD